MIGSRSRAEHVAENVLQKHWCKDLPVPVESIAAGLGAQVVRDTFGGRQSDVSGVLVRDQERVLIGVNSGHPRTRQRFTVAHELGHFLMHPGQALIVEKQVRVNYRDSVSSMATDQQEIEANQFAAGLLMPRDWVEATCQRLLDSTPALDGAALTKILAESCEVSVQAMSIRLVNLGILGSWQ